MVVLVGMMARREDRRVCEVSWGSNLCLTACRGHSSYLAADMLWLGGWRQGREAMPVLDGNATLLSFLSIMATYLLQSLGYVPGF